MTRERHARRVNTRAIRDKSAGNAPRSKVLQLLLSIATVACTEGAQKKSRAATAAATLARVKCMLMRLKLVTESGI